MVNPGIWMFFRRIACLTNWKPHGWANFRPSPCSYYGSWIFQQCRIILHVYARSVCSRTQPPCRTAANRPAEACQRCSCRQLISEVRYNHQNHIVARLVGMSSMVLQQTPNIKQLNLDSQTLMCKKQSLKQFSCSFEANRTLFHKLCSHLVSFASVAAGVTQKNCRLE